MPKKLSRLTTCAGNVAVVQSTVQDSEGHCFQLDPQKNDRVDPRRDKLHAYVLTRPPVSSAFPSACAPTSPITCTHRRPVS